MKITALLGVKDEIELIQPALDHLWRIGVDSVCVFDMGSSDGTLELLHAQRPPGEFRVIEMSDLQGDAGPLLLRRSVEVARDTGADWAMYLDADEFWIPASGRLKDCAVLQSADIVTVSRYNVALGADGPMMPAHLVPENYRQLQMFVEWIPNLVQHLQDNPDAAWSRGVPMPKIIARPEAIGALSYGMHHAESGRPEEQVRRDEAQDLLIAHLPFTTLSRFQRKLENIRRVFQVHDAEIQGSLAWHWRRWLAMGSAEEVAAEFERQRVDAESVRLLREGGSLRSAAEIFAPA